MNELNSLVVSLYVFFALYTTLFGIVIGSFLNVVIYRVPAGRTISRGHSMCMTCGHTLGAKDLVPLFSWLFLKGKCRYCGDPIASRYSKIESFTGLVFLIAALTHLQVVYLIVAPNIFFITSAIELVMFLTACCAAISAMMIYHDTHKGYIVFPLMTIISGIIGFLSKEIYSAKAIGEIVADTLLAVVFLAAASGIIFVLARLFKKNYTRGDLFADTTLLGLFLHTDYTYLAVTTNNRLALGLEFVVFAAVYGLVRALLKKESLEKKGIIIGFVSIVILVIIRYSIMKLIF